jgi:colicin import membrane protein
MMRRIYILLLALMPLYLWAQDNTWEKPEEEETTANEVKEKVNPDAKYLRGAVPEVDGKVVFTTTIKTDKSSSVAYGIVKKYMQKMLREKNQIQSMIVEEDSVKGEIAATFCEWLVFKSNAIVLDRTKLNYVLQASCKDGEVTISMSRIVYLYGEGKELQRYKAEEWICDKEAVNKKNTRLLPLSGKFRRKTIDRKDFLFNKFETLLK